MVKLVRATRVSDLAKYETKTGQLSRGNKISTIDVPLLVKIHGTYHLSNEWLLNHNGELIFDIDENKYIIPSRYDTAEYDTDIYRICD